jgi:hypothetical protein
VIAPVFRGAWSSVEDVISAWDGADLSGAEVLIAEYDRGDYDGGAFILFRRGGKLFEAYDSHCSCNGLENWAPEETTVDALAMRPDFRTPAFAAILDCLRAGA